MQKKPQILIDRENNIKELAAKRAELFPSEQKRPLFTTKIKKITRQAEISVVNKKQQPPRATKPSSTSSSTLLRTCSRSGLWPCGGSCDFVSENKEKLVTHLLKVHKFPATTEHLAPRDLALCQYCGGIYEGFRGFKNHLLVHNLNKPVCDIIAGVYPGKFPRTCWVWWYKEQQWWEGIAKYSKNTEFFDVDYGNDSKLELFHLVSFIRPSCNVSTSCAALSPILAFSPPTGLPDRNSSVTPSPVSIGSFSPSPRSGSIKSLSLPLSMSILEEIDCADLIDAPTQAIPDSPISVQGGVVIIRSDGNCLYHLANVVGDLCRDSALVSDGYAACTNEGIERARKHMFNNFARWSVTRRAWCASDAEFEIEVLNVFGDCSDLVKRRILGTVKGRERWGDTVDMGLATLYDDVRVVAIRADLICRTSSDSELEDACVPCVFPAECDKRRVICAILGRNHWDLAVTRSPEVKAVFDIGVEWDNARSSILNFVRSHAPLTLGGEQLRYGPPWEPRPVVPPLKVLSVTCSASVSPVDPISTTTSGSTTSTTASKVSASVNSSQEPTQVLSLANLSQASVQVLPINATSLSPTQLAVSSTHTTFHCFF